MQTTRLATLMVLLLAFGPMAEAAKKQKKVTLEGIVVERGVEQFLLQDLKGQRTIVELTGATKFEEKRSNFLRDRFLYGSHDVLRGLRVVVKGHAQQDGSLLAKAVRFTQHDLKMARVIDANLIPVDERLGALDEADDWVAGELDELEGFSRQNRNRAERAQNTADGVSGRVDSLQGRLKTTETRLGSLGARVDALDRYDIDGSGTVYFAAGSWVLTEEAKEALNALGTSAQRPGLIVEVRGFASADGDENYNRRLSQKRADAVVEYLIETHDIPPRRLIRAHGFGELAPVADNSTPEGREQNRRAEIRLLLNQGIQQAVSR